MSHISDLQIYLNESKTRLLRSMLHRGMRAVLRWYKRGLDSIACYSMVFDAIVLHCHELYGMVWYGWYWMLLNCIGWYWMVFDGTGWYLMVLDGIRWYWLVL